MKLIQNHTKKKQTGGEKIKRLFFIYREITILLGGKMPLNQAPF